MHVNFTTKRSQTTEKPINAISSIVVASQLVNLGCVNKLAVCPQRNGSVKIKADVKHSQSLSKRPNSIDGLFCCLTSLSHKLDLQIMF